MHLCLPTIDHLFQTRVFTWFCTSVAVYLHLFSSLFCIYFFSLEYQWQHIFVVKPGLARPRNSEKKRRVCPLKNHGGWGKKYLISVPMLIMGVEAVNFTAWHLPLIPQPIGSQYWIMWPPLDQWEDRVRWQSVGKNVFRPELVISFCGF